MFCVRKHIEDIVFLSKPLKIIVISLKLLFLYTNIYIVAPKKNDVYHKKMRFKQFKPHFGKLNLNK